MDLVTPDINTGAETLFLNTFEVMVALMLISSRIIEMHFKNNPPFLKFHHILITMKIKLSLYELRVIELCQISDR